MEVIIRSPGGQLEEVVFECPDLTWNQMFLDVDWLSREGHIWLRFCARGICTIEVPDQDIHRGGLAEGVEAQMMQ